MRAVKLCAGKNYLERQIQHLYPFELTCDVTATSKSSNETTLDTEFNASASEFKSKHSAAAIVRLKKKREGLEQHKLSIWRQKSQTGGEM